MPISAAPIPSFAPAAEIATVFGPVAALAAAVVLIALVVIVAAMVAELRGSRARARIAASRAGEPVLPVGRRPVGRPWAA